jgi:hypothetical protein
MNCHCRPSVLLVAVPVILTLCSTPVRASKIDETLPNAQTLTELEQRAQQANPRDQCYLYTELVHTMTEMAVKQIADGEDDAANQTLQQVNYYAHLIQTNVASNTKRLKNAEMLIDHTTFRLSAALHLASGEDKTSAQATLKQLNVLQNQLLNQVFSH